MTIAVIPSEYFRAGATLLVVHNWSVAKIRAMSGNAVKAIRSSW